jgi:hypothetical protein
LGPFGVFALLRTSGTFAKAADQKALENALQEAGLQETPSGNGGLRAEVEPVLIAQIAASAGVALIERTALVTFTLEPVRFRFLAAKMIAALLFGLAAVVLALMIAAAATALGGSEGACNNVGFDEESTVSYEHPASCKGWLLDWCF